MLLASSTGGKCVLQVCFAATKALKTSKTVRCTVRKARDCWTKCVLAQGRGRVITAVGMARVGP